MSGAISGARNVSAFVAIDRLLAEAGFAVPDICARDLDRGFLLISHLGTGHFLDDGRPVAGRYAAAAALLADLHRHGWPHRAEAAPGVVHEIPPFDRDAMLIEAELLLDWYTPYATGAPASQPMRGEFLKLWNDALDRIAGCEQSLVLRDYHSPNIIWRPERTGPDRMGLIGARAEELFGEHREIWIELDGVRYRLRITRRGKLILQK